MTERFDLSTIRPEPGDFIVAESTDFMLTVEQAKALQQQIKNHFPDNEVIVLSSGLTMFVARDWDSVVPAKYDDQPHKVEIT